MTDSNPYAPPITREARRKRARSSLLWFIGGCLTANVFAGVATEGISGTIEMTVSRPIENAVFFFVYTVALITITGTWKWLRQFVFPDYRPSALGRFICGSFLVGMLLTSAYIFKSNGTYDQLYSSRPLHISLIACQVILSTGVSVEIESAISRWMIREGGLD